jgi:hypothetical protein
MSVTPLRSAPLDQYLLWDRLRGVIDSSESSWVVTYAWNWVIFRRTACVTDNLLRCPQRARRALFDANNKRWTISWHCPFQEEREEGEGVRNRMEERRMCTVYIQMWRPGKVRWNSKGRHCIVSSPAVSPKHPRIFIYIQENYIFGNPRKSNMTRPVAMRWGTIDHV